MLASSTSDTQTAFALHSLTWMLTSASSFLWLLFLATLPSRILRPLRRRWVWGALAACAVLVVVLWPVVLRQHVIVGVAEAPWGRWVPLTPSGFVSVAVPTAASLLVSLLGLVVAWDLFLSSPRGSQLRRQAKAYLLAFGVHDGLSATTFGVRLWMWSGGDWANWFAVMDKPEAANAVEAFLRTTIFGGWYAATLAISVLLPYAVLRTQLFDIDLKIKWGLSRGTVAAAFLAVFFVVAQVSGEFLSQTYGYLAGGAAAGLLVFAFNPLQRAAERVAERAMPGVANTPEYVGARKRDVYRAALEGAMTDGEVTAKERDILTRLQLELGIANAEARAMEAELARATADG